MLLKPAQPALCNHTEVLCVAGLRLSKRYKPIRFAALHCRAANLIGYAALIIFYFAVDVVSVADVIIFIVQLFSFFIHVHNKYMKQSGLAAQQTV